ncbi:unnamed protein product [Blepharisma stoltei]|uniref:Uncharacterized protein n=1 Tax=Blepharisma stoltei TaxID=1481888 RepID=A0AAU9JXJ6_9CILI|nr:unnamed protein product [Blepharisma stoltei]
MDRGTRTPSTRGVSPSTIFNCTEVLIPDAERDLTPNLPLLHKRINSSFAVSQNTSLNSFSKENKKPPRSSSSKGFLRRNYSTLNKTSADIEPSSHLIDTIENIKNKVEKSFENSSFQQNGDISGFIRNIKDLEGLKHIRSYINEIGKEVVLKKQRYNEIHGEVIERQEKLKKLEEAFELLEKEENETNNLLEVYNFRRDEYRDFQQGLNNEVYYQETLKYMIACRQENSKAMSYPLNTDNLKLKQISQKIKKTGKEIVKYVSKFGEIKKQIEIITGKTEKERKEMEKKVQSELKVFEDYQKLKKCISLEHDRNVTIERQQNNAVQLLKFERKIGELKEEHIIQDEAMKLEKSQEILEKKLIAIQRVSNIATVQDMVPYYQYLLEKNKNLKGTVEQLQTQIDNLTQEKEELAKEADFWKFQDDSYFKLSIQEADIANEELEKKIDEIMRSENNLHKLQELINASVNVLSRVVFQLSDNESSVIEVSEKKLSRALAYASTRLDQMMEILQNHQSVFYIESINTGMEFGSAPSFLRLNNSRQARVENNDRLGFSNKENETSKRN